MWSKNVFKCMVPKPNAYSSKKYKKFHGIVSQKLSCIDQKYEKLKPNEKLSIKYKHFSGGSYMFISTSEILVFVLVVYDLIELIIEASY